LAGGGSGGVPNRMVPLFDGAVRSSVPGSPSSVLFTARLLHTTTTTGDSIGGGGQARAAATSAGVGGLRIELAREEEDLLA